MLLKAFDDEEWMAAYPAIDFGVVQAFDALRKRYCASVLYQSTVLPAYTDTFGTAKKCCYKRCDVITEQFYQYGA